MIFLGSSHGIEWSLDTGPDSVTLNVNDPVQEITKNSLGNLLLSQRQDFLNKLMARVPFTYSQQGTIEKRSRVLSSVGAQDMGNIGSQVSDLDDVEIHCEKN